MKYMYSLLLILLCLFSFCNKDNSDILKTSVGVFGGSVSSTPESQSAKKIWEKELNIKVSTHGKGGAGFTTTTKTCVLEQISDAPAYDVYILWASTNDMKKGYVGNLESTDLSTQAGAIKECVSLIRAKNINAKILFFISLQRYDSDKNYNRLTPFIKGQKEICEYLKIPYLDQTVIFDESNYEEYYYEDKVHLRESGYKKIAPFQVEFIKAECNIHS